ncbi:MAG TPA: isochorismatase family protein [Steroidobacteraceae bacterium]|nr:isochorismatase family protein [Steroidobacteraceae bacterium]
MSYLHRPPIALGPGERPAVLVVDFIEGFTSIQSPFGGPWDEAIAVTADLLGDAHRGNTPVIFTTVEFDPQDAQTNLLIRKAPAVAALARGSHWSQIDSRLPRHPTDLVISKKHGSAFFGTDLAARLQAMQIDTLLIAGCVTSGCVRASAVDAAQYGIRPLVVREAVGDRSPQAHEANLMDIEARYGDVVSAEKAKEILSPRSPRAPSSERKVSS